MENQTTSSAHPTPSPVVQSHKVSYDEFVGSSQSSAHSPGPWKCVPQMFPQNHSIEADGEIIAMTALEGETDLANARLLAAAPDLLEAAKAALSKFEILRVEKSIGKTQEAFRLREAIAKAEGQ